MPIGHWQVDPDLFQNEAEMKSRFRGYVGEKLHWSDRDKEAILDEEVQTRIKSAFERSPFLFDLYFVQSRFPDYNTIVQKGNQPRRWVTDNFGRHVGERFTKWIAALDPRSIRVVLTNNLSDDDYISLRSPWMVGHRISHALLGGELITEANDLLDQFNRFVRDIMRDGYGHQWNDWHEALVDAEKHQYAKLLGNHLGTMRSAREHRLVRSWEWYYESLTQYMLEGKIRFNILPAEIYPDMPLVKDRQKLDQVIRRWAKFPRSAGRTMQALLHRAQGEIFVI